MDLRPRLRQTFSGFTKAEMKQKKIVGYLDMVVMAGEEDRDVSRLEFEAWYDVDTFLSHRFLASGEPEVIVRYIGFGAGEDEWVNVRNSVRVRSVALDHTECQKVKVGDLVVCFQER